MLLVKRRIARAPDRLTTRIILPFQWTISMKKYRLERLAHTFVTACEIEKLACLCTVPVKQRFSLRRI